MPKMKTHRGAAKRFKKTASGKLKRWHAFHSHILTKKSSKRKQVLRVLPATGVAGIPELQREALLARQPPMFVNQELVDSRMYRALYSNRQLEEVLVDFWLNHFNVFNGKGLPCVNLANGMTDIHTPDEHIAVDDVERMVDVTLALVDAARETA